jgi:hypothetical protein
MYTRFLLPGLLLVAGLFLTGCFDEVGGAYDGPDQIAFAQVNGEFGTQVVDGAGPISVPTQLIGAQRGNSFDIDVSVEEDTVFRTRDVPTGDGTFEEERDIRALPTTAAPGNYSVPEGFTFPADSSNVPFEVQINDADISDPVRLTLRLDGNDDAGVEAADNWRYFEIIIVPN